MTRFNLMHFAKTLTPDINDLFPEPEQADLTTPLDDQLNLSNLDVPKKQHAPIESTRYPIDFDMELVSLAKHDQRIKRPLLSKIVSKIYNQKFTAKVVAPWFYAGETHENHFDLKQPHPRENKRPSGTDLILGIESSFNDTGVAVVRADGKVLANIKETF